MNQEKELTASDYFLKLSEEKGWFKKSIVPDLTNAQLGVIVEFAEKYANELLKLVKEEIESKKFSPKDDTVIVHNGALSLAIEIINEKSILSLKEKY